MLEKLVIRNFQKHKEITIEFDPQITTLWGVTDSGKSAIIRALRWLALNQHPKKHINWDSEWTRITLYVDGHKIVRRQGTKNLYIVDGEKFKAFGKGVPDQVPELLKLSSTNFQRQHEAHFWLSLTPGEVGRQLNKIVDLVVIDRSLSNINRKIKENNSKLEVSKERLEDARRRRDNLKWVTDANEDLKELELLQQGLTVLQAGIEGITLRVDMVLDLEGRIDVLKEAVTNGQKMAEKVQRLEKSLRTKIQRMDLLQSLINQIEELEEWVQSKSERLSILTERVRSLRVCPICKQKIPSSLSSVLTSISQHVHQ